MAVPYINDYLIRKDRSNLFDASKTALYSFVFSKNTKMYIQVNGSNPDRLKTIDISIYCKNIFLRLSGNSNEVPDLEQKLDYEKLFKNVIALDDLQSRKNIFTPKNKYAIQERMLEENIHNIFQTKEEKIEPELIIGEDAVRDAIYKTANYAHDVQTKLEKESDISNFVQI